AAYSKYMSGKTLKKAGWGILGAGLALTVGGAVMLKLSDSYLARRNQSIDMYDFIEYEEKSSDLMTGGCVLVALGPSAIAAVSVPLLCVGYRRTNHAHEIFNRQCATKEKLTLNLQASQNGLGLALNF
ncbi:MAG: hypothetical protein MJZ64_07925, partial [Paludibacteraceae bacterium]|nr:hypothetical protein [Paludibacteraceae bacterium]